nr:MAG TPA: major capsid protein [Caudoviricetes sp.]
MGRQPEKRRRHHQPRLLRAAPARPIRGLHMPDRHEPGNRGQRQESRPRPRPRPAAGTRRENRRHGSRPAQNRRRTPPAPPQPPINQPHPPKGTPIMHLQQQINDLKKTAREILANADNEHRDLTAAEKKEFDDTCTKAETLQQVLANAEANTKRLDGILTGDTKSLGEAEKNEDNLEGHDLGQRFVSGLAYKTWHKTADTLGTGGAIRIDKTRIGTMDEYFQAKAGNAIGTPIAHLQPTRMPAVDLINRPAITLLDLISRGSTKGDFEYLQILSVTRNTGIIPENTGDDATDTQKPQSTFATALADAKVYGYADGYTVTNQLLEDDSAMASFLQNEFDYSFQLKLADMLLNGTGTNGQPKGLLNTTGVQAGNWTKADDEARNLVVAIRQSLTKLRAVGATASAILVNPEDAEKIDLMTDVNKRFMGNGPFGTGPTTVWGRPLVECDQIAAGKAIVGDFRQMALLDRSGLTVEAFNQHKDYASRNLTYVRAELRAAQVIWRPANFVVLEAK